jgi:hypothetical protein
MGLLVFEETAQLSLVERPDAVSQLVERQLVIVRQWKFHPYRLPTTALP